jgi:AraC family transcriptional regulator of adaptative response/methylated-DNA-[protein]-cysteine methyltransferase
MPIPDRARIEKAITYIDDNHRRQPKLAEVAKHVGLSEYHFQRLFRRWAGVSPKRFLQYVTATHARDLLRDSADVLSAAYEAGLSGPGRLHDLMINVDAMTPGEVGRRGEGLLLRYGVHETPFGNAMITATDRGLCALEFLNGGGSEAAIAQLAGRWPLAELREDSRAAGEHAARIFGRGSARDTLALHLHGTNFQIRVWEALLRVPEGALTSYGAIAERIGAPRAVRAVGTAVGQNPIAYLIPCHRVIRNTGAFGEYRWGASRKRAMLGWESARRHTPHLSA